MHEELLDRRADYPILARKTYLISNSLGAMHRGTRDRLNRYADEWESSGVAAWRDWIPEVVRVADLVGEILGAPAGSTVLRQSVADLLPTVASCLDFSSRRNRIVYSDLEWPGSHYFWTEQRRYGAEPVVVPISDDGVNVDVTRLVDAIDDRTVLVPISHVLFRTATLIDVAPVVARAREVGALVLLDAYQSAGSMPIDVSALGVDFCVGGSVKYLSGGPGAGWLYVRPDLVDSLRPAAVSWFGHADTFGFEFDAVRYAPGIRRFTGGTPNVPAAYAAEPGYRGVLDAGLDRIRERSVSLTQPLVEDALARGFRVRSPYDPKHRGGHVTIDPGDGQRVHDMLHERGFVVDYRPGAGLRIAPHFYNTAEEGAAVLEQMAQICKGDPVTAAGATSHGKRGRKKRGSESAGDMVRSMLVVGGLTLTVLVVGASRQLIFPSGNTAERVRVVDYANEVAAARRLAPGAVLAPEGLPPRWRATSARLSPHGEAVDLHLGFVTPAEKYAELEASTGDAGPFRSSVLDKGSEVVGSTRIAGVSWEQRRTANGELALLRTSGQAIIIVTGNAAPAELATLASSLR